MKVTREAQLVNLLEQPMQVEHVKHVDQVQDENVNPVQVTPTISSKCGLYLLVLYVLSMKNTMLNAFNNFTASGYVQKMSCTTSSIQNASLAYS